ncbi:MAG TPA: hypothetical protein VFF32_02050 [Dermatophilaceae bacterium]|nr:hypothetical protein [Dermatophilaceae bacterium]
MLAIDTRHHSCFGVPIAGLLPSSAELAISSSRELGGASKHEEF